MSRATVLYYISPRGENPVRDFLDQLQVKQQVKILRIILTIESYGLTAILPHLRKLNGTPLWEMRILGKNNIRLIYITANRDSVILLHGFIKKSQKTPRRELEIALFRFKQWKQTHLT